ncbi:MAG TPA: exonuclease subunit SbcD [Streptosporangiaceae bacterium]
MKILHTSDWHVGKVLKGRDRHDEHVAALGSLVATAREQDADLVLIAGDLFETSAPTARSQGLVMRTLLALREDGRQVVVIAGNHDNQGLIEAVYRPVLGQIGLHVLGVPRRQDAGGAVALQAKDGTQVRVAALPFLSHRYAVRAAEVMFHEFAEHALDYSSRVRQIVATLTAGFTPDTVNVVMAHATLLGGRRGGGERDVQTSLDYELPASMFPASAHYVALGHLHRQQEIPGPCPIFYSGSPLPIDFGEEANEPAALLVTAEPGIRADATPVPVSGGRRLKTLRGSLDQVIAEGEQAGDSYLRVVLAEPGRAGLGDLVRDKLPNTLEVLLDDAHRPSPGHRSSGRPSRIGRSPSQLFGDYLSEQNIADPRLQAMFGELLDEITGSAGSADLTGHAPAAAGEGSLCARSACCSTASARTASPPTSTSLTLSSSPWSGRPALARAR